MNVFIYASYYKKITFICDASLYIVLRCKHIYMTFVILWEKVPLSTMKNEQCIVQKAINSNEHFAYYYGNSTLLDKSMIEV